MGVYSVRIEDEVEAEIEREAKAAGVGVGTIISQIVERETLQRKRERIRSQSRAVAEYVKASPEAEAFYDDWGTPTAGTRGT